MKPLTGDTARPDTRGPGRRLPAFFALRALEAAARHRSYSGAGRELGVTHGAVSQQIRRLEAELGVRLFVRQGHTMEPTPVACRLADEVARAVEILQAGVDAFDKAPLREPLVLSMEATLARRWLTPRLPRLLADPAGANLEVRVDNAYGKFNTEGVDASVRYGVGGWPGLEQVKLFPVTLVPVCSPDFLARFPIRSARDLLSVPLLHREGRPWDPWFAAHQLQTPPLEGFAFDDALMLLEATIQGLGAALVSADLTAPELASGQLIRPLPGRVMSQFSVYFVWRADSRKLERIAALRAWLSDEAAPLRQAAAPGAGELLT